MKLTQYIFALVVLTLLVTSLAYAQNAWDWRPPSSPGEAPACRQGDVGCYQPINVSITGQVKGNPNTDEGGLSLGRLVVRGSLFLPSGAQPGYVLTVKDAANGEAAWRPGGTGGGITADMITTVGSPSSNSRRISRYHYANTVTCPADSVAIGGGIAAVNHQTGAIASFPGNVSGSDITSFSAYNTSDKRTWTCVSPNDLMACFAKCLKVN